MLNRLKIGTKLLIGFILVILLLVLVGAVGYYSLVQCRSGFADLTKQIKITQGISSTTDDLYLAQIASANFSATKDTSYSDEVSEVSGKAVKTATETAELMKEEPESKEVAQKVAKNAALFDEADSKYKEKQLELNKLTVVRAKSANEVDVLLKDVIEKVLDTYKTFEKEKTTPISVKHVETYGKIVGMLETTEMIRRAARDLLIAIQDPKKTEQQQKAEKEAKEYFEKFDKECDELVENLTQQENKDKVAKMKELMLEWKKANEETAELSLDQLKLQNQEDEISAKILADAAFLVKKVSDKVTEVSNSVDTLVGNSVMVIIVAVILATIIGLICAFVLTSNITGGLKYAVKLMSKVAGEGDLSAEVEPVYLSRNDEIGALANGLKSVLGDYHAVDSMANSLAGNDWRIRIKEKTELDTMNINLDKMISQVNHALRDINESVKQVATGAGEVSSAATTLSSGAQESAASLEEITASMSEISSQTKANATSATEARDLAQKATHAATEGQSAMQQMTAAMDRITSNSSEIQRVIKVIDDIAFQTNLLALNAAVEAARAGAHGKGFAVVAEEVRNLAARSAKAAKETNDLISTSGQEITKGGEVASHTSEVLNTIADQIRQTTDLVAGIAVASNEQAQGVEQVTIGLQQIDAVTQQNTAAAEESASAANEMSSMAANLQQLVAKFQLRV